MAAWSDQDYRDDRLEDYGQHVGAGTFDDYREWSLDRLIDEINVAADAAEALIASVARSLKVDDPANERSEQGDDRPLTERAA